MYLRIRRILGLLSRLVSFGYSSCGRCGITWNFVKHHSTMYNRGSGMFPLCEYCWSQLTPEERLPFYRDLYYKWHDERINWNDIEKAVLSGK
jgi:hypothetical protein